MPRINDHRAFKRARELGESADRFFGPKAIKGELARGMGPNPKTGLAQFFMRFDAKRMDKTLRSFGIDKKKLVVGVAGYSGDMLRSLKKAGYKVAFTDINRKWVKLAKEGNRITKTGEKEKAVPLKGFAMNVLAPHINDRKISAVVSFEPSVLVTQPVSTIMPSLGAKNGVVLIAKKGAGFDPTSAESWANKKGMMEMVREYKLQVRYKEDKKDGLTFVQFKIPDRKKSKYLFDRECYESVKFRQQKTSEIAKRLDVPRWQVEQALDRYKKIIESNFRLRKFSPGY